MKRFLKAIVFIAVLALFSCEREEFFIDSLKAVPYAILDTDQTGLALYIDTSLEENKVPMHFDLSSPEGFFVWSLDAKTLRLEGKDWKGSSDICMPKGSPLPQGTWKLKVTLADGREFEEEFEVFYDLKAAKEDAEKEPPVEGRVFNSSFSKKGNIAILSRSH